MIITVNYNLELEGRQGNLWKNISERNKAKIKSDLTGKADVRVLCNLSILTI